MLFLIAKKLLEDRNQQNYLRLIERLAIVRFGSEEKARLFIANIATDGNLNDKAFDVLMEHMYLKKITDVLRPLLKANGYIGFFKILLSIKGDIHNVLKDMTRQELKMIQKYMDVIYKEPYIVKLLGNINPSRKKDKTLILDSLKITSKSQLAKEIEIDKKTLNKWLNMEFGSKFDNVRRLSIKNYVDIMVSISVPKDKGTLKFLDLETYAKILSVDLVHNRERLVKNELLYIMNYNALKDSLISNNMDYKNKKIYYVLKEKIVYDLSTKPLKP